MTTKKKQTIKKKAPVITLECPACWKKFDLPLSVYRQRMKKSGGKPICHCKRCAAIERAWR